MIRHILLLLLPLFAALCTAQDCDSACCLLGGVCGDAAFDKCPNGSWNYDIPCSPSFRTCCLPNVVTTDKPEPSTKTTTKPSYSTTKSPPPTNETEECGRGPYLESGDAQIVGGIEAKPNSWPWMVSLEFDYFGWNDWRHYCGASLLNNQWIMTAAHCIAKSGAPNPKNYRVVVGKHARDNNQVTGYEQILPVEQLIVHEGYDTQVRGSPYDLALVKLAIPVEYSRQVSPVCLPPTTNENFTPEDKCYIIGFGDTKGLGKENVLNEVKVLITPNKVCDDKWEKGSGRVNLIKPEHICAGNGVPGTCNGDSGGPLVCERRGRWVQAGVTSFGASGCTAENAPDVYTRISLYDKWIKEKIQQNS